MFEIVSEKPGTDFRGHINDLHQLRLQNEVLYRYC